MLITPSFKKSLRVEQFQMNYLKPTVQELKDRIPCWMRSGRDFMPEYSQMFIVIVALNHDESDVNVT